MENCRDGITSHRCLFLFTSTCFCFSFNVFCYCFILLHFFVLSYYMRSILPHFCKCRHMMPENETVLMCSDLPICESSLYEFFISVCGVNQNGDSCGVVFLINPNITLYQQEVESQCLKMDFTQECTNSCQAALNTFKTALGCCVKYTSNINRALWSACGIPFPEFCPSTLCLSPPINQVIPQPDHQLLALIAPFQPHQSLVNHQVTLQLGHQLQPHLHPHQS